MTYDAAEVSELRVLVEHLRRENIRLSDIINVSASAKIIADDAKAQAAEIKCLPHRRSWVMKSCPFVHRHPKASLAAALNAHKISFRLSSSSMSSTDQLIRAQRHVISQARARFCSN